MKPKINSVTRNGNRIELPEARDALDAMKYEIAREIGVSIPQSGNAMDWRMIPSYYCGVIGGEMVKRMIQFAQSEATKGRDVTKVGFSPREQNVPGQPQTSQVQNPQVQ